MEKYLNNPRALAVLMLFIAGISFSLGYRTGSTPDSITITNETHKEKSKERTVERGVTVVERPDGTRETKIDSRESERTETRKEEKKIEIAETPRRNWSLGLYANALRPEGPDTLVVTLDRRVWENVSAGVYARYKMGGELEAGVGLRIEF